MPPNAPLPTIHCLDCGHVNEGERVYCHNCGSKLDRSFLVKEKAVKRGGRATTKNHVPKMKAPAWSVVRSFLRATVTGIIYGAFAAIAILLILPQRDVPPMAEPDLTASRFGRFLENIALGSTGARYSFRESDVNAFLRNTVQQNKDDSSFLAVFVKFDRVFVSFHQDVVRFSAQGNCYGFPLFGSISCNLAIQDGALVPTLVGASVGRIELPSVIMTFLNPYKGVVFAPVLEKLRGELLILGRMSDIQVREKEIIIQGPKPARLDSKPLGNYQLKTSSLETSSLKTSGLQSSSSLNPPSSTPNQNRPGR